MGYYPLKVAEKDDVEEVIVYEINEDCIKFFKHHFSHRKGFEKIKIKHMDVLKEHNERFDYFFMDIYSTQLADEVLIDRRTFMNQNIVENYKFWCEESIIMQALTEDYWEDIAQFHEKWFFGAFFNIPYGDLRFSDFPLLSLR